MLSLENKPMLERLLSVLQLGPATELELAYALWGVAEGPTNSDSSLRNHIWRLNKALKGEAFVTKFSLSRRRDSSGRWRLSRQTRYSLVYAAPPPVRPLTAPHKDLDSEGLYVG